ncbi:MAG: GxxExxY protein [Anaerolineae bacterium]
MGENLLFKDECYQIQGAVFEVYRELGFGFLESVYQECLVRELTLRQVPVVVQPELHLQYKGMALVQTFRPDLVCYDQIIVELKAAKETSPEYRAQLMNYLKATGLRLGLLVNFGHCPKATVERIIL